MPHLEIPVIGIGAGADTDGQVLVFHDLLGLFDGHQAKFVKRYAEARELMIGGVSDYAREVRAGEFPAPEHIYSVEPPELDAFRAHLSRRKAAAPEAFEHDWDW